MPHRCVPSSFRVIYRRIMSIPRYDTLSLPAYGRPIPYPGLVQPSIRIQHFNSQIVQLCRFRSGGGGKGGAIVALTSLLRRDEF